MAEIGWIDFSSEDRDKVKQVLALVTEKGTLDELGIGQIRDAFSDLLFPGISTLQTRAKYFITIPQILNDFLMLNPSDQIRQKGLSDYLKKQENIFTKALVENHGDSEKGIIGSSMIEYGGVKRLPSELYWNGLRTFSLINTKKSLGELSRSINSYNKESSREHEEDIEDAQAKKLCSIHRYDPNWMNEKQSIELNTLEAEFLIGKMTEAPMLNSSIIMQLFQTGLAEEALRLTKDQNDNSSFRVLSELMLLNESVNEACKTNISLARDFSLAMLGPHIVLNLLLSRKSGSEDDSIELTNKYMKWEREVREKNIFRGTNLIGWLEVEVGGRKRNIKAFTKQFIRSLSDAINTDADSLKSVQEIVIKQSKQNKKKLSLLSKNSLYEKWIGMTYLDYRWNTAKFIVEDLIKGRSKKGLNAES